MAQNKEKTETEKLVQQTVYKQGSARCVNILSNKHQAKQNLTNFEVWKKLLFGAEVQAD